MIDWDALAGAGLRLLGDYCDGPHGFEPVDGVFRMPGGPAFWFCKSCFIDEWKRAGCPALPGQAGGHLPTEQKINEERTPR